MECDCFQLFEIVNNYNITYKIFADNTTSIHAIYLNDTQHLISELKTNYLKSLNTFSNLMR